MAAQEITCKEVLAVQRCILEEIESNNKAIVITVTYVSSYKLSKYFLNRSILSYCNFVVAKFNI